VNYDTIVGSCVVRPGTTLLGTVVKSNKNPLGLYNFTTGGGVTNLVLSVFSGASTASIYYYNGTWNTSGTTNLNNTAKVRFATLGGNAFFVNGVQAMHDSADGITWGTTNSITTDSVIPSLICASQSVMIAGGYSVYPDRVYFSSVANPGVASPPFISWYTTPTTTTGATAGGWIDVNPDDGGYMTAVSSTSRIMGCIGLII